MYKMNLNDVKIRNTITPYNYSDNIVKIINRKILSSDISKVDISNVDISNIEMEEYYGQFVELNPIIEYKETSPKKVNKSVNSSLNNRIKNIKYLPRTRSCFW